jgi:tetratricopeptide (TPR) repeat protein
MRRPTRALARVCSLVVLVLGALACVGDRSAAASQLRPDDGARRRQAEAALRGGRYDDALARFSELARAPGASAASHRGLIRALSEVGRYADADAAGRQWLASAAGSLEPLNALGEALAAQGKVAEAESAFVKASRGASDSVAARVNLGIVRYERGARAEAMRLFGDVLDLYQARGGRLSPEELIAVGTACRYLGTEDPQLFKDAVRAFDAAIAADSADPEPRVRLGDLFLEKYNSAEAKAVYDEALALNPRHPRALLGSARRAYFDGGPNAFDLVGRSLAVNPSLVTAHVFRAKLQLETEDYPAAASEAERALAVNPASLEALAILATARQLQGDTVAFENARRRVMARNARDAGLYVTLAEASARNRLYRKAVNFARQAARLDSTSSRAFSVLGINELRIGEVERARVHLERAFAGDPYDVWVKNTLDLLDTFKNYRETRSPRFVFMVDAKESELLPLYLGELSEEAYDALAARYGYRPPTPIRLEVYRSHADFSVRTVGLAGLGALGVSFGGVLAMDSPAARKVGEFNWGSTLWHEVAHTFTLGMSDFRVPRWLSEGMSVYEERRARPGWGADASPGFLVAYKAGKLRPVSRLNDGFIRPRYPEEVIFSYYAASLVCELVEREGGIAALTGMLRGYGAGWTTGQVFARVLKTTPAAFDEHFDAYVRQRFATPLAAIRVAPSESDSTAPALAGITGDGAGEDDFVGQLVAGRRLYDAGKSAEAVPFLERAKALFPEYAGDDSPYWYLALIHEKAGAPRKAAHELARLTSINESHYAANLALAELLEQLGDDRGAAAALERAVYITPYDLEVHARLAALLSRTADRAKAVRERRAVVALAPVDRSEALYQLALAYYEAGDMSAARREVLRALEVAPNFERAQELLLKVRAAGRSPGKEAGI